MPSLFVLLDDEDKERRRKGGGGNGGLGGSKQYGKGGGYGGGGRGKRLRPAGSGGRRIFSQSGRPNVVIKMSFQKNAGNAAARASAWAEYSRGDRDKPDRGDVFDKHGNVDPRSVDSEIQKSMGERPAFFSGTISPGDNAIDLRQFTQDSMELLEKQLGQPLSWWASVHTDTEHHHAHILFGGKDEDGKQVNVWKSDLNGWREACNDLLARMRGMDLELDRAVEREFGLTGRADERLMNDLGVNWEREGSELRDLGVGDRMSQDELRGLGLWTDPVKPTDLSKTTEKRRLDDER